MCWFSFTSLSTTLIKPPSPITVPNTSPLLPPIVLLFLSVQPQWSVKYRSVLSHLCIKIKCKVVSIASRPCMIEPLPACLLDVSCHCPLLPTLLTPAFFFFTGNALNLFLSQVLHTCSFLKSKSSFYTLPDELLVILGLSLTYSRLLQSENQVPC